MKSDRQSYCFERRNSKLGHHFEWATQKPNIRVPQLEVSKYHTKTHLLTPILFAWSPPAPSLVSSCACSLGGVLLPTPRLSYPPYPSSDLLSLSHSYSNVMLGRPAGVGLVHRQEPPRVLRILHICLCVRGLIQIHYYNGNGRPLHKPKHKAVRHTAKHHSG